MFKTVLVRCRYLGLGQTTNQKLFFWLSTFDSPDFTALTIAVIIVCTCGLYIRGNNIPLQPWNVRGRWGQTQQGRVFESGVYYCMNCTKTSGLVAAIKLFNRHGGEWKTEGFIKAASLHKETLNVVSWLSCCFSFWTVWMSIWAGVFLLCVWSLLL